MACNVLLLLACVASGGGRLREAPAGVPLDGGDTDGGDTDGGDTDSDGADDTGPTVPSPCPDGMAQVDALCIDRWEAAIDGASPYEIPAGGAAVSIEGQIPQGYISGDVAAIACEAAGKRLCSLEEWMSACAGAEERAFPYGDTYDAGACNDSYAGGHPVIDYFGTSDGIWDSEHMNDPGINQQPGTLDPAGANPGCVTPEGVFDLHGNLHEWISDPDGTFKGGFYADASINGTGCAYRTTAHSLDYHDYSTGFRCCRDAG